jgi:Family of unknown function (DUF6494)
MEMNMNDETFNLSIRKFLKTVGVSSQREIEQAVAKALLARTIGGGETFAATMRLQIPGLQLDVNFDGEVRLE